MDPNQALADLLKLAADLRAIIDSGEDPDEPGEYYRIASEAVEKFEGLHDWLSKGGFLPAAWAPAPPAGPVLHLVDITEHAWRIYGPRAPELLEAPLDTPDWRFTMPLPGDGEVTFGQYETAAHVASLLIERGELPKPSYPTT